ncbi:MAG: 3-dehydroquinate synthase [Chitinispirillaceae bacterium]
MEITVNLDTRSYPVIVDRKCMSSLPSYLKKRFPARQCAVVTNTTIQNIYSSYIANLREELGCRVHVIPDGEKYKTIETWSGILDFLISNRLDRTSYIIALGGGVVGDISGFAAACFLRGVEFVQVPTTLLAMVDSSVGGKTAVDHPRGKNLIGAFHQPSLVWIDTEFLQTLPRREFVAGYAECFKTAFIGGREMFSFIMKNKERILSAEPDVLLECIKRSIEIKARVVEQDEKESGKRALLNFGHTFGHALEHYYGFEGILHGEGVLWGIRCAVELGKKAGTIPEGDRSVYDDIMEGLPLPSLPGKPDIERIYSAMFSDKKVAGGKLRFVVPTIAGSCEVKGDIGEEKIREVLKSVLEHPESHSAAQL